MAGAARIRKTAQRISPERQCWHVGVGRFLTLPFEFRQCPDFDSLDAILESSLENNHGQPFTASGAGPDRPQSTMRAWTRQTEQHHAPAVCVSGGRIALGNRSLAACMTLQAGDYQGETILVVDDDPSVVTMCEHALKFRGYRVLNAHGAEDALCRSQGAAIHVALIDVMMPGTNGIELARILSQQHPDTKVIFMSGFSPTEISRLVGDYRHFGFIWKPFRLESLFHMVENVLSRPQSPG
jgi:CheY-like chemotaxis protein